MQFFRNNTIVLSFLSRVKTAQFYSDWTATRLARVTDDNAVLMYLLQLQTH